VQQHAKKQQQRTIMIKGVFSGYLMMLITAIIWGFAFVAQKSSMEIMGPFTFNAARFVIGASCLLLLLPLFKSRNGPLGVAGWRSASWMGLFLFLGAISQQIGLVSTTAGKAAFITGLYIVLVPLILALFGQILSKLIWLAVALGLCGLYLLSIQGSQVAPETGDIWVLASALFFALHIVIIGRASLEHDALRLSIVQFYVCAAFSLIGMWIWETPHLQSLADGWIEILYAGVLSVGVAYTLQVFAQIRVPPHAAALVLSLETVFGAIGGVWLLGEEMTPRMLVGAGLMMLAILVAQFRLGARTIDDSA
jgi:drug/metabolite transporter (DMT)-like permease